MVVVCERVGDGSACVVRAVADVASSAAAADARSDAADRTAFVAGAGA
jgi:hypothetical protein